MANVDILVLTRNNDSRRTARAAAVGASTNNRMADDLPSGHPASIFDKYKLVRDLSVDDDEESGEKGKDLISNSEILTKADTLEIIKCSMSFGIDGSTKPVNVVFELYPKLLPKTCANFLALCLGGLSLCGHKMQYKNSYLHEIVPDWCVVGGDFLNGNGTGGHSIFHGNEFEDESFQAVDYEQPGLLCMLSHGPNTNTSLFFVTLKPAEWINKLYVAFGKVVENFSGLEALAREAGSSSGIPKKPVKILSCGPM